jgi:hypothetical protein
MSRVRTWAARLARGHTRLALRLFLFNALLVFLPVAGLWYLDAYEQHLPSSRNRAMVQQARFSGGGASPSSPTAAIGADLSAAVAQTPETVRRPPDHRAGLTRRR